MEYYDIPLNLPEWMELIPTPNFGGSAERLCFKDLRTGTEISTYYDNNNNLGFFGTDTEGKPKPYFEAYPIDGGIERCETPYGIIHIVWKEFDRLWREIILSRKHKPEQPSYNPMNRSGNL